MKMMNHAQHRVVAAAAAAAAAAAICVLQKHQSPLLCFAADEM